LKGKLINNRIRWYGYILRINKERISKKVLNMKVKGKCPRGKQQVRKDDRQNEGRTWEEIEGGSVGSHRQLEKFVRQPT
jgi:hypothetical protein